MAKRENGEGSISWDKARNKYRAAFIDPNKKRIYKRFDTREEAKQWLTEIKSNLFRNEYVSPSNITLGEWILEWLQTFKKDIRPMTKVNYMVAIKHLKPIENITLQDLTSFTIQKYLNTINNTLSKRIYFFLNAAFKQAQILNMISKNPMDGIEIPRSQKKEIKIFTKEELKKIFDYLKTDTTPTHYKEKYLLILLAATTGVRIGELLSLKWENINLTLGTISITSTIQYIAKIGFIENPPKTNAGKRIITLAPHVINELKKYKKIDENNLVYLYGSGYVFHTQNGTPYCATNIIRKYWKPILFNAGVPYRNFHALRHTHATQLLADGIPILEVSKRLGHSRASNTLNLYGHAIPNLDKDIANKITKIYSL